MCYVGLYSKLIAGHTYCVQSNSWSFGSAFCSGNVVAYTLHVLNVSHTRRELAEVMHALLDSQACDAGYP